MYKVSLPFHKYATNQPNQVETIHPQGQQALTDPIHNKVNLSTGIHQNMPAWHHTYIPCTQPQYIQSVDKFSKLHQPQQVQDSLPHNTTSPDVFIQLQDQNDQSNNRSLINANQGHSITDNRTHTVHGTESQTNNLNQNTAKESQKSFNNRKEIKPYYLNGAGKTEWADYIIHFDQCSAWNQWTEPQKAQMLTIHLRGEAQKLLSSLTESQLGDYSKLKTTLTDRYDPKEKESLYRCQFRQFKRERVFPAQIMAML